MSRRHSAILVVVLTVGCSVPRLHQDRPILTGPQFSLAVPEVVTSAQTIAVDVLDRRPDWEKLHYTGSDIPEIHELAIAFIPMESFHPMVIGTIEAELANRMGELSDPPLSVELKLESFRVVFDDTENQRARYQTQQERKRIRRRKQQEEDKRRDEERKRWERKWKQFYKSQQLGGKEDKKKDKPSVGSQLVGWVVGALAKAMLRAAVDSTALVIRTSAEKTHGNVRVLTTPPNEIRSRYTAGLTCEIKGTAVLTWQDGRTVQFQAVGESYRPVRIDQEYPPSIPKTVRQAIINLGEQVMRRGQRGGA